MVVNDKEEVLLNLFDKKISKSFQEDFNLIKTYLSEKEKRKTVFKAFKEIYLEKERYLEKEFKELEEFVGVKTEEIARIFDILYFILKRLASDEIEESELKTDLMTLIEDEQLRNDLFSFLIENKETLAEKLRKSLLKIGLTFIDLKYRINVVYKEDGLPFNPKPIAVVNILYEEQPGEIRSISLELTPGGLEHILTKLKSTKTELKKAKSFLESTIAE